MKKQLLTMAMTAATFILTAQAQARPAITQVCQTQKNAFSEVTACDQQDMFSGQSYGTTIYYKRGLLNVSRNVLVGGVKSSNGYSFNIYDGTSDFSNKPLYIQNDGTGAIGFPGAGAHQKIEIYFMTQDGQYDSVYGNNYVFQF